MKTPLCSLLTGTVSILAVGLLVGSLQIGQAQIKGPGRPPQVVCNNNSNCEYGEANCADCSPQRCGPLSLIQNGLQAVTYSQKILQYEYAGPLGSYRYLWASGDIPLTATNVTIGDVDNDGQKEIVAVTNTLIRQVKSGKTVTGYYNQKVLIFEDGCPAYTAASWTGPYMTESTEPAKNLEIADVDHDGRKEIVILKAHTNQQRFNLEVYRLMKDSQGNYIFEWDGGTSATAPRPLWISPFYYNPYWVYSMSTGDTDGCGFDEIVLSMFRTGAPIIWKYDPLQKLWTETAADPIYVYNPSLNFLGIDYTEVRNVDDQPGNEIISGGNNNRLMVWKLNPANGHYESVFVSGDLNSFTQGLDAGDIDGCGLRNEIAIGATYDRATLYVFKYDSAARTYVMDEALPWTGAGGISVQAVGDLNRNGKAEIVLAGEGITFFERDPSGRLAKIYNSALGDHAEIK